MVWWGGRRSPAATGQTLNWNREVTGHIAAELAHFHRYNVFGVLFHNEWMNGWGIIIYNNIINDALIYYIKMGIVWMWFKHHMHLGTHFGLLRQKKWSRFWISRSPMWCRPTRERERVWNSLTGHFSSGAFWQMPLACTALLPAPNPCRPWELSVRISDFCECM